MERRREGCDGYEVVFKGKKCTLSIALSPIPDAVHMGPSVWLPTSII